MSTEVKLKKATEKDAPLIVELLKGNGLPHEDIYSKLDCLFMAEEGARIVGIGGVEIHEHYGLLRSLVIEESSQGRGFGKALCKKLIEYVRLRGIDEIYPLTTTAEGFFEKIGFERIKRNTAPSAIQDTPEFRSLCPASAVCMRMKIH